eukprot:10458603-Ditylum_brightwellii.AAC.1
MMGLVAVANNLVGLPGTNHGNQNCIQNQNQAQNINLAGMNMKGFLMKIHGINSGMNVGVGGGIHVCLNVGLKVESNIGAIGGSDSDGMSGCMHGGENDWINDGIMMGWRYI